MKAMIVSGSRNPEGQTARAAGALLEGLQSAGAEGEIAFLPELDIECCRQCDQHGWGKCREEGACVIEDDFAGVVDKLRAADVIAFATPVYFHDLSESMQAFISRLARVTRHEAGKEGIAGKPAVGICVAGGGGSGAPACALRFEKMIQWCGYDVVDMVPARRQNLDMKVDVLKTTGAWLAGGPSSG